MCMSCGCGEPNNDHGDKRNITQNNLDQAAQAAKISASQAAQNIMNASRQSGSAQGGQRSNAAPGASA